VQELNKCQRNLVVRVEALCAEIAQLKVHDGRSDAAAAGEQNNGTNCLFDNDEERVVCEEENTESAWARRKRVQDENAEVTNKL
jgi:hypothetical protein